MPYKAINQKGEWVVINKETGKIMGRHGKDKEKAMAQVKELYANVPDMKESLDITWYQPLAILESGIEEASNRKWCRIGGVALTQTASVNGRRYTLGAISENNNVEVSVFSEHRPVEEHVVGKVKLVEQAGVLRYDGKVRNTAAHPDIVEKCQDGLLKVSIGAGQFEFGEEDESGNVLVEHLRVNHLGLVGIPGIKDVSMEYAIAESYDKFKTQVEQDEGSESRLPITDEVKNMEEVEQLKQQLAERDKEIAKLYESRKQSIIESILKLNPKLDKNELAEKDEKELKIIEGYESKISALKEEDEGGIDKGGAGEVELPAMTENAAEGIVVERDGSVTMSKKMYDKFNKEIRESIYR